jgi:prepilin-type N-terminal cleavage/methylation domain-containing protein
MKKQHFSLVELLVVIAIIAILAGLIIPTVGGMREKARATQAKAEMNAIKTAILAFESTYGVLPLKDAATPVVEIVDSEGKVKSDSDGYERLMEWLTQVTPTGAKSTDITYPGSPNTRKIKFLDPRSDSGVWLDPWGQEYVICMDNDYDGQVKIENIPNLGSDNRWAKPGQPNLHTLNGSVFIYSFGPNKNNDWGLNNTNGGAKSYKDGSDTYKTDDINTWDK